MERVLDFFHGIDAYQGDNIIVSHGDPSNFPQAFNLTFYEPIKLTILMFHTTAAAFPKHLISHLMSFYWCDVDRDQV